MTEQAAGYTPPPQVKIDGVWHVEGKPREDFKILARYHPSNLPGKSVLIASIDFPPNGSSPPHRHGGATAFAFPYFGTSINQMNGDAPKVYGPGEFWYEAPGCHHQKSENPSSEERAKFLAVLIVDDETVGGRDGTDFGNIFVLDKEVEERERAASK